MNSAFGQIENFSVELPPTHHSVLVSITDHPYVMGTVEAEWFSNIIINGT